MSKENINNIIQEIRDVKTKLIELAERLEVATQSEDQTPDTNGELKEYQVEITEYLKKTVCVEAHSSDEANEIVEDRWRNSEYILDADCFDTVSFVAKEGESYES